MANVNTSGSGYEKVVIDTNPGTDGFFTNPVVQRKGAGKVVDKLFLLVQGTGEFTPILQFKMKADTGWTDYVDGSELPIGTLKEVNANAGNLLWRAGIKQGWFTSGTAVISIIW